MNFGEKLKQIRMEKGLTQPQFAEAIGIEQSYLSKLENDKSVPSAEMFGTIISGLGMEASSFLQDLDKQILNTTLRHIPEVSKFTSDAVAVQVHNYKRWVFGSGLAWIVGFALMLAANDGIFFSNKVYRYMSPGVILAGEAENIFEKHDEILFLKAAAQMFAMEEALKRQAEFKANRVRPVTVESKVDRGSFYVEQAENGRRRFDLVKTEHEKAFGNRIIHVLGATIFVGGFVSLFLEWRLRRIRNKPQSL